MGKIRASRARGCRSNRLPAFVLKKRARTKPVNELAYPLAEYSRPLLAQTSCGQSETEGIFRARNRDLSQQLFLVFADQASRRLPATSDPASR